MVLNTFFIPRFIEPCLRNSRGRFKVVCFLNFTRMANDDYALIFCNTTRMYS